jgi:type II secretory pathway component PulK
MKDIEPFLSPVDGTYVTSRSELREHEKRHNVRQIGNDWAGSERPSNWDTMRNVNN